MHEAFQKSQGYFARIPKEKLSEISKKGNARMQETKRTKKMMVDVINDILSKDALDLTNRKALKDMGLDADLLSSSMLGLAKKAERGDTKAIELIAKLRGEYVEKVESTMTVEDYFKDHELEP